MQREITRTAAVGLALVVVTSISACSGVGTATATPSSRNTATPSASPSQFNRDALVDEASALFNAYISALAQVDESGGKKPDRLRPYLTAAAYQRDLVGAMNVAAHHYRTKGPYHASHFTAQSVDTTSGEVRAYVCLDGSKAAFFDAQNKKVKRKVTITTFSVVVTFTKEQQGLRIKDSERWSGQSVC